MPRQTLKIQSILGGIGPSRYFASQGQYLGALGIDPDYPFSSTDERTSGAIVPTLYDEFSSSSVNGAPIALINDPKDTNTYAVLSNGKLFSYNSSLAGETSIGTVTGSVARGGWYYNNFIWIATGTDLSKYGPLNNSPTLTNTVWTTSYSLTALTDTTYPTVRGLALPNHWGCVHGDGASYFLDFKDGQGMVHKLKTSKTTDEGDTNNGSAYNVLDLPFGFYPTAICSYSTDLAILAIQTTDATVNQGKACLFLWDPTNTDTFYRQIYLPDPLATALEYVNGRLFIWTGNAQNGFRVSQYVGGDTVSDIVFMETGTPAFPGAVDAFGDRIVWGSYTEFPSEKGCVFAYGSKNSALPKGVHNIVKTTAVGTDLNVTSVKYVQQASNIGPKVIAGWRGGSSNGIDKLSTSNVYASVWDSEVFQIGRKFRILRIRFPVAEALTSSMRIDPYIYLDNGSTIKTLTTLGNGAHTGQFAVTLKSPELGEIIGINNFYLELAFTGSASATVIFPIEIEIEVFADET